MSEPTDTAFFEQILAHLQQTRGFDFTAYKRNTLMRRIARRLQVVGLTTFEEYFDYLQVHQDEFSALFNTVLINVTSFFRDPDVWAYLDSDVLPPLLEAHSRENPLRVWSAGCASGQEPYTLAMLLAERIGAEDLRDHVKIYATDIDEEALVEARQAAYTDRQIADVPEAMRKYFDAGGAKFTLNRDVRRAVIFGTHDLLSDAPISRIDLLLCRNTLMYFNSDAQARVLARFYFSTNPSGVAVLGRAEMLFSQSAMFIPIDLKRRVFRTVPKPTQRDRLLILAQNGHDTMASNAPAPIRLRDAAFEASPQSQLVLDISGIVAMINAAARTHLGLGLRDVGKPFQDLAISYRPAELRAALDRVLELRREVTLKEVAWPDGRQGRYFDVVMSPLFDDDGVLLGTCIAFAEVTQLRSVQDQLKHSRLELETAYEELQSTNEELETTNEELQSTVEELETTNEELQSTNEELETMNEELQSTNEELQTMNDELRNRGSELTSINMFLESVFAGLRSAVVVIDHEYRVQVWNHRAEDLWGVRADEVNQSHFLNLDIGLPVAELRPAIRSVLGGAQDQQEVTLAATSRRGKPIDCRVTVSPLRQENRAVSGAILLMEERFGNP
jgi:two-component system CheB/CheR fusion protein